MFGPEGFGYERKVKVMRFVSRLLPRLINGADGRGPFIPDACCYNYSLGWTVSPILAVFRTLLNVEEDRRYFDTKRIATCDLYESVFESRT